MLAGPSTRVEPALSHRVDTPRLRRNLLNRAHTDNTKDSLQTLYISFRYDGHIGHTKNMSADVFVAL